MSWAWSFYLREQSSLYRYKRIMSSHLCSEWSLWSFSSKMSKMSIMLIMLTVITSDSSDQSNHFKTLITQWLFNYCCYIISCERVLINMRLQNQIHSVYAKFKCCWSIQSSLAHQTSAYFKNEKNFKLYSWMSMQLS